MLMNKINLNTAWSVRYEGLEWGGEMNSAILQKKDGWLQTDLPCDIHMPLLKNSIIKEPLEEDNSYFCEWTEDKSWWFKKVFEADSEFLNGDMIELTLESLDAEADIFLNGWHLGHHKSAFYPFVRNVKKQINEGENVLLVRLSSGAEYVSDYDIAGIKKQIITEFDLGRGDRGDRRRVFLRKPQYVFGWDWGPRVATCGIVKGAWIESLDKFVVRSVYAHTVTASQNAEIAFEIEIENLHPYSTIDADVKLKVMHENDKAAEVKKDVFLRSGKNYISINIIVRDAKLWWPNGMGDQPLYNVRVSVAAGDARAEYPDFKFGIRTICLDQDKIGKDERRFAFVVNGITTFCKGGNWIPADSVYARVTDDKYTELIKQAKEANFNMLRIWGGGIYERDIFYQKCDEYGIMLWHDFMFACALYPDNNEWFKHEVEKEMDYQTARLRNYASMALWCGNNENHWGFDEWWNDGDRFMLYGGEVCYNHLAPHIVQKNCPHIFYWNSSPYGGEHPNGNSAGDRHHWHDCTMHSDMERRITPEEYDKISAKFISEYGYIGPCCKSSIIRYHGDKPIDRNGRIWQLHNNTLEKETVKAGIKKHYTDPEKLDVDGYLLYAGLCQGLMLGYSLEAIRFKESCGGALFWMYNDCWGEIGWTIIDYYMKRKISYYFVKRALSAVKLIMREEFGMIRVMGANDTCNTLSTEAEYGYIALDGSTRACSTVSVEMEPHSRKVLFEFKMGGYDLSNGLYFIKSPGHEYILPAILNQGKFRELKMPRANINIMDFRKDAATIKFTVSSDTYAHAVHFNLDDSINLSDEYFDLLPGELREVTVYDAPEGFTLKDIIPNPVYPEPKRVL